MSKLRPISAPLERRWREFRYQYLPIVAFTVSVAAAILLWGKFAVPQRCDPLSSDGVESSLQIIDEDDGAAVATAFVNRTNLVQTSYSD
jgi:hypothetical protein